MGAASCPRLSQSLEHVEGEGSQPVGDEDDENDEAIAELVRGGLLPDGPRKPPRDILLDLKGMDKLFEKCGH